MFEFPCIGPVVVCPKCEHVELYDHDDPDATYCTKCGCHDMCGCHVCNDAHAKVYFYSMYLDAAKQVDASERVVEFEDGTFFMTGEISEDVYKAQLYMEMLSFILAHLGYDPHSKLNLRDLVCTAYPQEPLN